MIVNPLRVKNWIVSELEASLVLFGSGASRESAAIIDEQVANVRQGNARSIEAMHQKVGGFGTLLVLGFDYVEDSAAWRHSLELLQGEVLPRIAHL